ncbi:xanthine dehydrogenase-like, partial [Brachionus plicatilis]
HFFQRTKVYCHEGGCGSCVVCASYLDKITNKPEEISVNSCLFPLYSCDGYSFTTVEGLGSKKNGLHPVQKRLADKNGSQCGYCSPGFVMTMYSKLKNNPRPSKEEIEKSFDGSMTSFASDKDPIDIEDLTSLKCLSPECDHDNKMLRIDMQNKTWFAPVSLEDLFSIFYIKEKKFRLMFGNTSIGVYKKQACFDGFINVKGIQELYGIKFENDRLTIGANCSLSNLIRIFAKYSEKCPAKFGHLKKLGQCFLKIGNVHVRNSACWAGNLAVKKQFGEFPSDVMTILETSGAKLNVYRNIRDLRGPMEMNIENFLHDPEIVVGEFLIESLTLDALDQEKTVCMYRKVMPRSQNAHAYVNSGFRFEFESAQSTKLVNEPLLCFNGIDENFFHAEKTQKFLQNKDLLDSAVFTGSVKILNDELRESGILVQKDPLLTTPDYRISLALSMYYKFYIQILHSKSKEIKTELKSLPESIVDSRKISNSEESVEIDNQSFPLTKPIPKLNAYSQTSGETKYVDDLPPSAHQTHGAFILSTIASAKIDHIDIEQALNMNGVLGIYLAKDIPGENNLMPKPFIQEPIFADKEVIYARQPIGLVVAKTKEIAKKAAGIVRVKYTDIKKPILNIQDAIAQKSFHPKPSCGDIIKGKRLFFVILKNHLL